MTSELSKYLNEQLGVTKMKLAKNIKKGFLSKSFIKYLLYKFLKISYILF